MGIVGIVQGTVVAELMDTEVEETIDIGAADPGTVNFFLPAAVSN